MIEREWGFAGLCGLGAFAVGFCLAVITLVQLRPTERENFDEVRRKQLYITAWVYIGFLAALFVIAILVAIATRNPQGHVAGVTRQVMTRSYSGAGQPAIF